MGSEIPKVLHLLNEKPLIIYVIDSLNEAGVKNIKVVVGYRGEKVIDAVGNKAEFVWQHEQLGTGHAVMQAENAFKDFIGRVIVACGDVPMISSGTFKQLIEESEAEDVRAAVITMELENPEGYGRIIKDSGKNFVRIVEEKDARDEEKKIKEVNTGTYIFDSVLLFSGLKQIDKNNAQGEYYLPDVLEYIIDSGYKVKALLLEDPDEGRGINTIEELKFLENHLISG